MHKCIGEWLQQDFKEDEWVLQGPERMGKNWSIFFKGPGSSGSRRAKKALDLLRDGEGKWQDLWAEAPGHRWEK
eukprot:10522552-Karenia_brevis.AAC.1